MGRAGRRWIAASGGVLINGLILAALVLVEQAPPLVEDPPVIVLDLERVERQRPRSRPVSARAASASRPIAPAQGTTPSVAPEGTASQPAGESAPAPPATDPAWTVDPKAVEHWRLTEGNPAFGWGRYYRACKGLSNEHMRPDEKERCYGGWNDRKDKRPSPSFVGPIDETKWEVPEPSPKRPSTADEDKRRRRDLCRTYDRLRKANPAMPPVLRQGACP